MAEKHICIHGHFYQPPRENPWLEAVEAQDSAYPYHDWNERITAECYAPNTATRALDHDSLILDIISNYSKISFNFGPTLLSWMQACASEVYEAIVEADRQSVAQRSGHGNALAQVYNHIIMPLANERDRRTQVRWGIYDFEHRFGRFPEGMWLAETAVDIDTLENLAEAGIRFTILAQHQAWKVRKINYGRWKDVKGARIDPSRAYLCKLPSGRSIDIFFYDGPISRAVAFEKLLDSGEKFAARLMAGFSEARSWPQLMNIATDGETYGHHHKFGEMALGYALRYIEEEGLAKLTNYGEFLERNPPTHEVRIFNDTSWSCAHGIERWKSNCGCNSGGNQDWNQEWRAPLRETLDWLRDALAGKYEEMAWDYLKEPWSARDDYIKVILDRSDDSVRAFINQHAAREPEGDDKVRILKLLEIQRHALLMYTSCGWFFDELSGIETVQVMQYAGRAVQLSEELFGEKLEEEFVKKLSLAQSNIPELGNGEEVYKRYVKPAMVDLPGVGIHYAISSLFEEYREQTDIFSYRVTRNAFDCMDMEDQKLATGSISVRSAVTSESADMTFCVLHEENRDACCCIKLTGSKEEYESMKNSVTEAFKKKDAGRLKGVMEQQLGAPKYCIKNLFRDEQRKILDSLIRQTHQEFDQTYLELYEKIRFVMELLRDTALPLPHSFLLTAEIGLNIEMRRLFYDGTLDLRRTDEISGEMKRWDLKPNKLELEFIIRRRIERNMEAVMANPFAPDRLDELHELLKAVSSLDLDINLWQTQNMYFALSKREIPELHEDMPERGRWREQFINLGEMLHFNVNAILHKP